MLTETILRKVFQICKDIEAYISYTRENQETENVLVNLPSEQNFSVWTLDSNLKLGFNVAEIDAAIRRCSYERFYILLIIETT